LYADGYETESVLKPRLPAAEVRVIEEASERVELDRLREERAVDGDDDDLWKAGRQLGGGGGDMEDWGLGAGSWVGGTRDTRG
jgi:hypothetical protein